LSELPLDWHQGERLDTDASDERPDASDRSPWRYGPAWLAGILWELPLGMLLAPRSFLAK
jgi:hypothetical protein